MCQTEPKKQWKLVELCVCIISSSKPMIWHVSPWLFNFNMTFKISHCCMCLVSSSVVYYNVLASYKWNLALSVAAILWYDYLCNSVYHNYGFGVPFPRRVEVYLILHYVIKFVSLVYHNWFRCSIPAPCRGVLDSTLCDQVCQFIRKQTFYFYSDCMVFFTILFPNFIEKIIIDMIDVRIINDNYNNNLNMQFWTKINGKIWIKSTNL